MLGNIIKLPIISQYPLEKHLSQQDSRNRDGQVIQIFYRHCLYQGCRQGNQGNPGNESTYGNWEIVQVYEG